MPGGNFPIKVLKPAMQSLHLGIAGMKAQLVDRLVLALQKEKLCDADASAGDVEAEALDVEEDLGRSTAATTFAERASAAWQEYSGGGAHVYEDALEDLLDAEEADVRAEQEALLQLRAGVNPPGLDLGALRGTMVVLAAAERQRVLSAVPPAAVGAGAAPTLAVALDPTQRAAHDRVSAWAQEVKAASPGAVPPAPC